MDTIRLLVCIVLALPCGVLISRLSATFVTERPLFQPSETPRVSQRTIVVGSLTLVTFVLLAWRFADASWLELLAYLAGFAALLLASAIDFTEYRLPDVVVLPTLAVGLLLVAIVSVTEGDSGRARYAVLGAAIAFGVLLVAHLIILVLWVFLIGFAFGTLGGIALLVVRGRNQPFPFGPFLAMGTLATVLVSRALVG